jgi:hypothetical protein
MFLKRLLVILCFRPLKEYRKKTGVAELSYSGINPVDCKPQRVI